MDAVLVHDFDLWPLLLPTRWLFWNGPVKASWLAFDLVGLLCIVGGAGPTNDDRALGSAFVIGILGARTALNRFVGVSASFRPGTQASKRGCAGLANRLFDPMQAADDPGKGQEQYPAYCRRSDLSPG